MSAAVGIHSVLGMKAFDNHPVARVKRLKKGSNETKITEVFHCKLQVIYMVLLDKMLSNNITKTHQF